LRRVAVRWLEGLGQCGAGFPFPDDGSRALYDDPPDPVERYAADGIERLEAFLSGKT
jgi:hypothetical protein